MNKVAVVTHLQTEHSDNIPYSRERMMFELVRGILDDVQITRDDIDVIVSLSNDFQDGRTISQVYLTNPMGAYFKGETKNEDEGIFAFIHGVMRILSGEANIVLVIGHSYGGSQFKPIEMTWYMLEPTYERPYGVLNEISTSALQAQAYSLKYGMTEEHIAKYAVKNLRNASKNPCALRKMPDVTETDVLNSKLLYHPIRELMMYPPTDGGCAILLASEEIAKELTDKPVWVLGMGWNMETYYFGERILYRSDATIQAAKMAYKMARIDGKQLDFAEIHAPFAHQEPIIVEALGVFEEGTGAEAAEKGWTEIEGRFPVNPSGGALGVNPLNVSGLIKIAEVVSQLRGEAGELQVKKADIAVAQSSTGICAQQSAVVILGR